MATIFSRIVKGEIPCYKVAETADFLAFLDVNPVALGHTLVIPKQEIDYLFDLPDDLYIGLNVFSREVAHALKQAVPCVKIGTCVIGLEVPHAHMHLIPINKLEDMRFDKPKLQFPAEEMQALAAKIGSYIAR